MFLALHTYKWYVKHGKTEMRTRSNTLAMLVANEVNLALFEKSIFIFCESNRKVIRARGLFLFIRQHNSTAIWKMYTIIHTGYNSSCSTFFDLY